MGTAIQPTTFELPPMKKDFARLQRDERWVVAQRDIRLMVVEVQAENQIAIAVDDEGRRYGMGLKTTGVDVSQLREGQMLVGDASRFHFVLAARAR